MKKIALLLLILMACLHGWATAEVTTIVVGQPTAAAGCTDANPAGNCTGFLVCQNFEGTGLDNSETYSGTMGTADWYIAADDCTGCVQNIDYTSAPLRGTQSLQHINGTAGGWVVNDLTSVSSFYIFFRLKLISLPSIDYADLLSAWGTGLSQNMTILMTTDGELYLGCNVEAEQSSATTALTVGTTYYVWGYFAKGTGNNAQSWLRLSTTRTMPDSNTISKTDFNMTDDYRFVGFTSSSKSTEYEYIIDQVLIKSTDIGTVCE